MSKSELIDHVANETGLTKAAAKEAIQATFSGVTKALQGGGRYSERDFGTFKLTRREARQGRNPHSGLAIHIAAKNVVKFKASPALDAGVQ